jgi:uncharacterized protein YjbI with pentapeptide repeats
MGHIVSEHTHFGPTPDRHYRPLPPDLEQRLALHKDWALATWAEAVRTNTHTYPDHPGRLDARGEDLHQLDLMDRALNAALLDGADLRGTALCDALLNDTSLRNAHAEGSLLVKGEFWRTDLSGAVLRRARMLKVDMWDVALRNADLSEAEIGNVGFFDCDLRGVSMRGALISAVSFVQCRVEGLDMTDATGDILMGQKLIVGEGTEERLLEKDEAIAWLEEHAHMDCDIFVPLPR